ncbi:MAG TPA: hypothetical protein VFI28_02535 [Candidatus Limnocylindrales bacterium]|nr:hypothetical protein [Candidatus Limnocylindrales bacterium]
MRRIVAVVVFVCLAAGCAARGAPASSRATPAPLPTAPNASVSDEAFELRISTPSTQPAPNEPITIETTVTYIGDEAMPAVAHAAGGPVAFELVDVDHGRSVGPVVDDACARGTMRRGVAMPIPFMKSGAFEDDAPADDFVRRYLADPVLRLPEGHWRVVAHLVAFVGDCTAGGAHELQAAVELVVGS